MSVHTHVQRTLKEIINVKKNIKVVIPENSGVTSRIYITIDDETVRVPSKAFLNAGVDVVIFTLSENDSIPTDADSILFQAGKYSISSIIAIIGMKIGKHQKIKVEGCNTSN